DKISHRVVSAQTSESMRYLMRSNATHGSASFANVPGYYVGGKTGTADKIIHGHYSQNKVFTTFMAITPADKPKYLFLTIYDDPEPAPEDHGFHTAAYNAGRVAGAALGRAAARLFPRQPATVVAVTGTSGKTSVVAFVRQIWLSLGREAASFGTIGVVSRPLTVYGSLTTPDPIELHQTLDRLARAGVTHLAMEASSHGLDQKRLDGVNLSAGAFTNLTRDHMDYHPTVDHYFAAKLRLFRELLPRGAPAV